MPRINSIMTPAAAAAIALTAHASSGTEWVRFWDPGGGESATGGLTAIAPDGSIYTAGRFGKDDDDMVLIKYDTSGETLWIATYDGPVSGPDAPTDIEVTKGGVSIVGTSVGERGPQTVLLEFDTEGALIRERRTLGPEMAGFLQPQLAIGADGRRVIATDDGAGAAVVEAYASDGDLIFQTHFSLSGFSGVSALALTENLDAYVVMVEGFNRYVVHKLDPLGREQWSHTESFAGLVLGEAFIVVLDDDVVIVGSGEPPTISPAARVWRHSADGTVQWTRELPEDAQFAIAVGLSAAPEGGVYLAARGGLPQSWLAHLDSAGEVSWITGAGGDGQSIGFSGVATASNGSAIVGGSVAPVEMLVAFDVLVRSYSPSGSLEWSRVFAGKAGEADFFNRIATGPDGAISTVATIRQGVPFQNIATLRYEVDICTGDIDGDGSVGISDLITLLAAWGEGEGSPADLNGDGSVSLTDLLILLAHWGPCA